MKNELYHHGIRGQKWGIRRYQNKDGSLTMLGKKRYGKIVYKIKNKLDEKIKKDNSEFLEERKHELRMRIDPTYRSKHTRRPFDEKPSKRQPFDEKPSKTKSLEKSKSKSTKKMSDEELQNRINRLKKEAEYKDLKKRTSEGKEYTKDLMKSIGKQAAITATVAVTTYAAGKILKKG